MSNRKDETIETISDYELTEPQFQEPVAQDENLRALSVFQSDFDIEELLLFKSKTSNKTKYLN